MRRKPVAKVLAAASALLLLGSATGLVSGGHTCSVRIPSAGLEIHSTPHPDQTSAAGEAHTCYACVVSAQLSGLDVSGVLVLLPPQSVGPTGIDEPPPLIGTALRTRPARAPPPTSSESRAV